jgi:hypothetical protein
MNEQLDTFIDQFYSKYSPNDIPQGERRARLKAKLNGDFDGYVTQMYSKYSPDNVPDSTRLSSLKSKYLSSAPAPVQDAQPSEPTPQQPEQPTQGQPEAIGQALESTQGPVAKGVYDFGRSAYSFLTDAFPQAAAQSMEVAKTALNPSNIDEYVKNKKSVEFQRYVRDNNPDFAGFWGFAKPFDIDTYLPKHGKQFMESEGLGSEISKMEKNLPNVIERRKNLESYVQQQKDEAAQKMGGVVQSYKDISSPSDLASYIGNMAGQLPPQILLSAGTKGASSFMMELASVYDKELDALADKNKISREQVIERNLDRPAEGIKYAMAAAGLDAASAGNLVSAFRKNGGGLLKKLVNQQEEGITEAIQGALEDKGAGANGKFEDRVNEYLGGVIGGSFNFLGKSEQKSVADNMINETADTGDASVNATIDADANLTQEEENIFKTKKAEEQLEEVQKVEDKLTKEEERQTKATESQEEANVDKSSIMDKTEESVQDTEQSAENTAAKPAENKQEKVSFDQTPEYLEADNKVKEVADQLRNISPDQDITELVSQLNEAKQARDNARIASEKITKPREEKSVKMTPNEAIKLRVQNFYKGVDKGVRKGVELNNELVSKVQDAIKEYPLTPRQTSSLLTKVRNTNLYTPGSISKLNDFIDKVTGDAEYADKLYEAKSINKKLRKLAKSSNDNLQNIKSVAKEFASINPEDTFINKHLELAKGLLSSLTSPKNDKYKVANEAEVQQYVSDLKSKIQEDDKAQIENDTEVDPEKKLGRLRISLKFAQDNLNQKDLSEFDDREKAVVENIKGLDPNRLNEDQLLSAIRVVDNIVENDDLSNTGKVEAVAKAQENIASTLERLKDLKRKEIGVIGKVGASTYQQFTRIFGDSGLASEVQSDLGILDVFNAGSRVEKQELELTRELQKLIEEVNKKYKTKVQELENQVRLVMYSELVKNYGDDSHITKVQSNLKRTIAELEQVDEDAANVWKKVYPEFDKVETVSEAKLPEGLMKVWEFFNNKFKDNINPRLKQTTSEVHNKSYLEAQNYSHTQQEKLTDTSEAKEQFGQSTTTSNAKVKPSQSKTSVTATRSLRRGYGYSSDWVESQLRGYRDSLYDIEASKPLSLVRETLYSPEFQDIVGGLDNAKLVRKMIERAEKIQQGATSQSSNDFFKLLNNTTQFLRNIGAVRALARLTQPASQVPSVWSKAFFNHIGSGSLTQFFQGVRAVNLMRTSPELKKLFDQYTVGVRGERLGGIERGDAIGYKLSTTGKAANRAAEWLQSKSDAFSRKVLYPLTSSDTYAARTTWLGYYLQSLKEQGIENADLTKEHSLQTDPTRKKAAAFAEQMIAETQVPSNPATLAQISRNENDSAGNFAKNVLLPFSVFSTNAKYRMIQDVEKFVRTPNSRNAGAVAGDVFELLTFAAIAYGLLPYYKDFLKDIISGMTGVEGDDDEEKKAKSREKAFYSNLVNSAFPFSIGTPGEAATSRLANSIAHIVSNPDMSYTEWKKETGGFIYEPDKLDLGVLSLGTEPFTETIGGTIDLAKSISGQPINYESFGQTREVNLSEEQQNLLAFKTLLDIGGIWAIQEADIYNQTKKLFKESLKSEGSSSTKSAPRRRRIIRNLARKLPTKIN